MKQLLLIILTLCLASCKDKNTTESYCKENSGGCQSVLEGKKYFAFKRGSWWVYEEENSGKRDSVYVTDYASSGNYDFDIRTHSTLDGYNYHYWPFYAGGNKNCSQIAPVNIKCMYITRSKYKAGDFIGEDDCFFVQHNKGDYTYAYNNIHYPNNKIIVEEIYPTYSIGKIHVGKTVKIHELSTMVEGIQPTNHYWAENVGLIRKELLDSNQVWNLINYHIQH